MKLPISLVIISSVQDQNLNDCIKSAPFVSEVLVIMTNPNFVTLAEHSAETRIFSCQKIGLGEQKKWGVTQAQNDWVLCLESNERVSEELALEIVERFQFLKENTLYRLPRVAFYMGSWIWHGGYFPDFQARLFNRRFYHWNEDALDPQVEGGGYFDYFTGPLEHFIFKNFHHQVLVTHQAAVRLAAQSQGRSIWYDKSQMVLAPIGYFLTHYFIKQGFRDGWPGFILVIQNAHALFMQAAYQFEQKSLRRLP